MLFTSKEIMKLEEEATRYTTLYDLMEVAGAQVYQYVSETCCLKGKEVLILCGKGNNGGDGFVCAQELAKDQVEVKVLLAQGLPKTELAKKAFETMPPEVNIYTEYDEALFQTDLIIDGIFGFNFRGSLEGELKNIVTFANQSIATRIAIDIPSGALCDTGEVQGTCFQADRTITFTSYKPAHFLTPAAIYCGEEVKVVQVGIRSEELEKITPNYELLEEGNMRNLLPVRRRDSHKGSHGRLVMICGSYGMLGAAVMAGKAALRTGVGLLEVITTKESYPILAPALPEAIFKIIEIGKDKDVVLEATKKATACLIGSGLGSDATWYMEEVFPFITCPIVIDGDGLNYLARNLELLEGKQRIIVTPHPKEMSRLLGKTVQEVQRKRLELAKEFAKQYRVCTVLKGMGTIIAAPSGEVSINPTGNQGMAKAGSGDVLAGIIASLAAQNLELHRCGKLGVYIHGYAGDITSKKIGMVSMLPTDYIEDISTFFEN